LSEVEFFKPAVDPVVGGGGDNEKGDGLFFEPSEELGDAVHGGLGGDGGFELCLAGWVDAVPVVGFSGEVFEVGLGRPGVKIGSDALDVGFEGELLAFGGEEITPGFVDGPFGVEDDAVEVAEDGFRIGHVVGI